MSEPTVRPTSPLLVVAALLSGAIIAALAYVVIDRVWAAPPSPGGAASWIAILALLTAMFAWTARRQIQLEQRGVAPETATRWLALGKTGAFAGAALTGVFLAWALASLPRHDTTAGGPRMWWSFAAAAAAAAWCLAGLLLERWCRIPRPPRDDDALEPHDPNPA